MCLGGAGGPIHEAEGRAWHCYLLFHLIEYFDIGLFAFDTAPILGSPIPLSGGTWHSFLLISDLLQYYGGSLGAVCSEGPLWGLWGAGANPIATLYTYVSDYEGIHGTYSMLSLTKNDRECRGPHELRAKPRSGPRNSRPDQLEEGQCVRSGMGYAR